MPDRADIDIQSIPMGPGHPVEEKLRWAHLLHDFLGAKMKKDRIIKELLEDYREKIAATWLAMDQHGITEECTICAMQDGGSCCGQGIENKFDVITLLVNLLMETKLPDKPWDPTGCWFLGERGCLLTARHVICVNFICKRLYAAVPKQDIQKVQQAMQAETDSGFLLEEYLKSWLIR
ncbi:MAG: hypothetical protein DSZ23_02225, partial [Thermodesulfatator sp.]